MAIYYWRINDYYYIIYYLNIGNKMDKNKKNQHINNVQHKKNEQKPLKPDNSGSKKSNLNESFEHFVSSIPIEKEKDKEKKSLNPNKTNHPLDD